MNVFQYVSQVSSRITRQSVNNLLFVPKAKAEYYRRSFVISSCNLWNNMSNEMRESTSLEIFKTKYLNEYFNWNIIIIQCITLFLYWFYSFIIYCVNTVYNAGPHCKLVCITKCVIHSVEIKDIIIIIIIIINWLLVWSFMLNSPMLNHYNINWNKYCMCYT